MAPALGFSYLPPTLSCLAAVALAAAPMAAPSAQLAALLDDAARWRFLAEPLSATFAGIPGYEG